MITQIKPRWNSAWANSPDIEVTLDRNIYKEWEWLYEKIPPDADSKVMLLSTNNWPWVRFVYVDKPDGAPNLHGALGGDYKLTDGTVFKSRSGWSSRSGVINRDFREYLPDEIAEVIVYTPDFGMGFAGTCISQEYLKNHPLWPKDCYLVRELQLKSEPYWNISLDPSKVVKGED